MEKIGRGGERRIRVVRVCWGGFWKTTINVGGIADCFDTRTVGV